MATGLNISSSSQKVILLDAVSTLIETHPSVIEVYHQVGLNFGSSLEQHDVRRRFKAARRELFAVDTSANDQIEGALISSDAIERELWRRFIEFVFHDLPYTTDLFHALWDFFADADNWRVYPDAVACLAQLKRQGHYVAIASNFDSRLIPIVGYFEDLSALDNVFCSAGVGFRKPDPAFYREVIDRVSRDLGAGVPIGDIVFAGDCIENDFWGPRRMGWSAFWLDRRQPRSQPKGTEGCPKSCRIVSLEQLPDVLK